VVPAHLSRGCNPRSGPGRCPQTQFIQATRLAFATGADQRRFPPQEVLTQRTSASTPPRRRRMRRRIDLKEQSAWRRESISNFSKSAHVRLKDAGWISSKRKWLAGDES
jgi:hypothetical protein